MTPEEAYVVLGISSSASKEEIRDAFKLRSRMMHPDRFAGKPDAEVQLATREFQRISAAYELVYPLAGGGRSASSGGAGRGGSGNSRSRSNSQDSSATKVRVPSDFAYRGGVISAQVMPGVTEKIRIPAHAKNGDLLKFFSKQLGKDVTIILVVGDSSAMSFEEFVRSRDAADWSW